MQDTDPIGSGTGSRNLIKGATQPDGIRSTQRRYGASLTAAWSGGGAYFLSGCPEEMDTDGRQLEPNRIAFPCAVVQAFNPDLAKPKQKAYAPRPPDLHDIGAVQRRILMIPMDHAAVEETASAAAKPPRMASNPAERRRSETTSMFVVPLDFARHYEVTIRQNATFGRVVLV